jgi:hypothetical protein
MDRKSGLREVRSLALVENSGNTENVPDQTGTDRAALRGNDLWLGPPQG